MVRDYRLFIGHMLESIEKVSDYTRGLSKEQFLSNAQVQDAVMRRIEVMGEAAKADGVEAARAEP